MKKTRRHTRSAATATIVASQTRRRSRTPPKCSPKVSEKKTGFSCYSYDDLKYLKRLWNNSAPPSQQIRTTNPRQIHANLTKYTAGAPECSGAKESCWLHMPWVKSSVANQIKGFAFAPEAPTAWSKNPNEWLSSDEIEAVMAQYAKAYPAFEFIGPSPIDFDVRTGAGGRNKCVWPELCNFSVKDMLKDGITKVGMIFNTDPHDKPGQHWISMFVDLRKGAIYFFDSVGAKAPPQIMALVERIQAQGEAMTPRPIHFKFDQNWPTEHQYGNTECGIYSLYFIVHMLEGRITSHYLKTHILRDKYMERFRKIYFNDRL